MTAIFNYDVYNEVLIHNFLPLVPSETPPNTIVQSTSSTTIEVSWEPINQAYVHGILLGYEVRFAKDDGSPLTWETRTVNPNTHRKTLSGLWYYSKYRVVVCAKTSKGCGKEYYAITYTWDDGKYMVYLTKIYFNIHLIVITSYKKKAKK